MAMGAAGVTACALAGCSKGGSAPSASESVSTTFFCFDTVCTINGWMPQDALDAAVTRCLEYEKLFSRTVEGSDVWNINHASGAPVQVHSDTADLIARALEYCEQSEGDFDITIGAVSQLWDFKEGVMPASEAIEAALPHVDYHLVGLEGDVVTLADPEAALDLGGIAKGWVADALLELLSAAGVSHACINLGGNVAVMGGKPDGSEWNVGIRDPNAGDGTLIAKASFKDGSVVTSGLDERRFEKDGRTYWHILDPRTGYPVETDVMSATVASPRSVDGDGCTKQLVAHGFEAAARLVDAHPDFSVLLVYASGEVVSLPDGAFQSVNN